MWWRIRHFWDDTPFIYGDGRRDDTPGLKALFSGKPVRMKVRSPYTVVMASNPLILDGLKLLFTKTVSVAHAQGTVRISNSVLINDIPGLASEFHFEGGLLEYDNISFRYGPRNKTIAAEFRRRLASRAKNREIMSAKGWDYNHVWDRFEREGKRLLPGEAISLFGLLPQ